jgi:magnesium transporter
MLTCYASGAAPNISAAGALPDGCVWFDLVDPSDDERKRVEAAVGLGLPDREHLGGIELSNRVGVEDHALRLGLPYFGHDDDSAPTPLGLVLTPKYLVSLRYAESAAFKLAAERVSAAGKPVDSMQAFAIVSGAIIATTSDQMESLGAEIAQLSGRIFDQHRRPGVLRRTLSQIGHVESRLTRMRLTATGLLRIVAFLRENPPDWLGKGLHAHLDAAHKDLDVLCEFDNQLTDKLQFLLDAVLGFINIDQNDVIKILTVASVVSIPPVILAGIWGMNFEHMPELHLPHAYPIALVVIALSIVLPLLWFKRRGWM